MFVGFELNSFSHNICLYRQFSPVSLNQYRQRDAGRPAIIKYLVHCGTDGTAGIQHIINQDDVPIFNIERQAGRGNVGV